MAVSYTHLDVYKRQVYDGRALVNDTVTGSEAFVEGEGATFAVTGSQTIVGSSPNEFTYELTGEMCIRDRSS